MTPTSRLTEFIIELFILIVSIILILFPGISNFQLANIHFYLLAFLALTDFKYNKRISLSLIWIGAFLYIILSDMLQSDYTLSSYDKPIRFLLSANDFVLLSYYYFKFNKGLAFNWKHKLLDNQINRKRMFRMIVFLYILAITFNIESFIINLTYGGRAFIADSSSMGGGSFTDFFKMIPLFLPALIAFYNKDKNKFYSFLICLPLFLIVLSGGTRYKMLFSLMSFLFGANILPMGKIYTKKIASVALIVIIFVIASNIIKQTRGISNFSKITQSTSILATDIDVEKKDYLSVQAMSLGSPELIVDMTRYADIYFENHPLQYGKNSLFIFYFWIPRSWWPEKPTMLDNWLPNYFLKVSSAFSSSSGFCGELRADFGLFSYFFLILIGMALAYLDRMAYSLREQYNNYYRIIASLLYPFVFFFVRSPVTSMINMLTFLVWIYVIGRLSNMSPNR